MARLLVADDTPIIRSTIARVVERDMPDFCPVIEASNGAEAVELARQAKPDIVLMDIKMPALDGIQASTLLRAELPLTRIIILSAYDEFCYVQRALKLGVVDYLLKPIRPAKLTEILIQVYDQIQAERQQFRPSTEVGTYSEETHPEDIIQHALDYIHQNQHRADITLAEVAAAVSLSTSHLAHLLKERAGASYKQHLTSLRIESAKRLLRTTNLTISAIGEEVGYPNATNFYRLFQRETGVTPASYRRCA
jgi:two-component system response regulator YesN